VLEPQGTAFFLLLMVVFAALLVWVVLAKQVVFRVLAACLAFLPAMVFGIAAVNKYYDYYQTWGSLYADMSGSSGNIPDLSTAAGVGGADITKKITEGSSQAQQLGYLFQTKVTGGQSHISRDVYVWLPPQYFSPAYKSYKFPVIELLHGSPGQPSAWVNVMDIIPVYLQLLATHQAAPAVVVMPDTDGGQRYSLQCLNYPGLPKLQDMQFVALDVPNFIARTLRVQPPGRAWGLAGYSEGGYCAANIGLQYPYHWGFIGSLSGYFNPIESQIPAGGVPGGHPIQVMPFQHNARLMTRNTPTKFILRLQIGVQIPEYWLAAGAQDTGDVRAAEFFREMLMTRLANVPLDVVPGGGHQARVWRAALAPMLAWMTPQLQQWAQHNDIVAQHGLHPGPSPSPSPGIGGILSHPAASKSPTPGKLPLGHKLHP
jgi:enterochelin esterase-like enzyme